METLKPYIDAIIATWQASAIWICIFGFLGRLAATPKGRPMAGAWLGILLGPIGVMIAFGLASKQPERKLQPSADQIRTRAVMRKRQAAATRPPETELERWERQVIAAERR
jgi:hypothetical protein